MVALDWLEGVRLTCEQCLAWLSLQKLFLGVLSTTTAGPPAVHGFCALWRILVSTKFPIFPSQIYPLEVWRRVASEGVS